MLNLYAISLSYTKTKKTVKNEKGIISWRFRIGHKRC